MILLLIIFFVVAGAYAYMQFFAKPPLIDYERITARDIPKLFPQSPSQIARMATDAIEKAKKVVAQVIAIPNDERTFANTIAPIDRVFGLEVGTITGILWTIKSVSPNEDLRVAADKHILEIGKVEVDLLGQNVELYNAFKAYYEGNAQKETLTKEQRYYLDELMKDWKRAGLDKPEETRNKIKEINKELMELSLNFSKNIDSDNRSIQVTKEELEGMDERFIEGLERTADGKYILPIDYPIIFPILDYCTVAKTREQLWEAFVNRGVPANEEVLKKIIQKRDELAKLLDYESYAALNIDSEMAENPDRVRKFLSDMLVRADKKQSIENKLLISDLPASVQLVDNKFYPWDFAHTKAMYEKKNYNIDKRKVAEYFPMENTLQELLAIYRTFMGVEFKELPVEGLWNSDVKLIEVSSSETQKVLGYLLLDLYPRPDKYSHACEVTMIPAIKYSDGSHNVAFAIVIANFPKPTAQSPSLLPIEDVRTFFHEFGHALHSILGATELAMASGTHVKTDFVELPSQMLEEWLWDNEMIKKVSHHYQTGAQMPDELIDVIVKLKNANIGSYIQRQIYLSFISLDLFDKNSTKETRAFLKDLYLKTRPWLLYDDRDRQEYSFGHLTGYGARYYGYLWSKVFALDVFDTIKKHGLLNSEIGTQYVNKILAKGGSADPNDLLKDFLGREPNSEAFFRNLGL